MREIDCGWIEDTFSLHFLPRRCVFKMLQMGSIFILTTKTLSFFLSLSHILRWIVHRDTEILKKIFLMKIYPSGPPVVRSTLEPVEGQEYWQSKLRGPPACLAPELQCWPEDETCGPEELKKKDAEKCRRGVRQETQGLVPETVWKVRDQHQWFRWLSQMQQWDFYSRGCMNCPRVMSV